MRPVLGRVYLEPEHAPGAKTHNVTVVHVGDLQLLVDPGFGGLTPTAPLDLGIPFRRQETPHETHRVIPADDADRTLAPGLGLDPVGPQDLPAVNRFVSTSPASHFTTSPVAALAPEGRRDTIGGTVVRSRGPGGSTKRVLPGEEDLVGALGAVAVDVDPGVAGRLAERLLGA